MVELPRRYSNTRHLKDQLTKLQVRALQLADHPLRPLTPRAPDERLLGRLGPDGIAQLVAEYEAGADTTELVAIYGIGKGSVIRLLHDQGVPMRRQGMTEEQHKEVARLYQQGDSLATVGRQLGFDAQTIRRALLGAGVRMRDSHGRER